MIHPMKKFFIQLIKLLSWLPAIAMMLVIYSFSSQTGDQSGQLSYEISYEIVELKDQLLTTQLTKEELVRQAHGIHYYVRKGAHITEFFLLAIAVSFPLYVYGLRGLWLLFGSGIICVGFAGFDEYHQSFVSSRGPSLKDVGIDSIGIFLGILLVQTFCWSATHSPRVRQRI